MPTWRKLHVKITESLDFHEMPDDFTRLAWVLLPCVVDSAGRGIDAAAWLKSRLFPLRDDVTAAQLESALAWYADRGMVKRYTVAGRRYFCVVNFRHYQGNNDREAPSHLPSDENAELTTYSRPTQELVMSKSSLDVDVDVEEIQKRKEEGAVAPPPKPSRKVERAELLDNPAVVAYRDKMLVTPPPAARKAMAAQVKDLELWGKVLAAWATNSYNPQNVAGMLDAYSKGGVNGHNGHRNGGTVVRGAPPARKPAPFNVKDARTAGD